MQRWQESALIRVLIENKKNSLMDRRKFSFLSSETTRDCCEVLGGIIPHTSLWWSWETWETSRRVCRDDKNCLLSVWICATALHNWWQTALEGTSRACSGTEMQPCPEPFMRSLIQLVSAFPWAQTWNFHHQALGLQGAPGALLGCWAWLKFILNFCFWGSMT